MRNVFFVLNIFFLVFSINIFLKFSEVLNLYFPFPIDYFSTQSYGPIISPYNEVAGWGMSPELVDLCSFLISWTLILWFSLWKVNMFRPVLGFLMIQRFSGQKTPTSTRFVPSCLDWKIRHSVSKHGGGNIMAATENVLVEVSNFIYVAHFLSASGWWGNKCLFHSFTHEWIK